MKPNKLELENIGPFRKNTVIDFAKLGNMFLICGDTGAGKTTILDSICFALYGSLPGSHPKMIKNLRSDFAEKGEIAKVSFDFSINGSRYKIDRTPPCPYIDRKGNEAEKPAEVVLYKFCGNDKKEDWSLLFNKTNEANEAIENLIGLKIDEFSKIVLLPQGDFAEFLRLSSNQRKDALAKLFPIDDYRLITEFAKSKEDEFRTEHKIIEAQLAALQKNFDAAAADETLKEFGEKEKTLNAEQDELYRKQLEYAAQIEKSAALEKKFDDLENLKKENENVLENGVIIEELESKLENNKKALLAKVSFENFKDKEKRLKDLEENVLAKTRMLESAKEKALQFELQASSIDEKKEKIKVLPVTINELERALTIEKDIIPLKQECLDAENAKNELSQKLKNLQNFIEKTQIEASQTESLILPQEELDSAYDKASAQLSEAKEAKKYLEAYNKLQHEMENAKEGYAASCSRYECAKKAFDLLKTEINELESQLHVFDQNKKAFELAKDLQEGEPCPVCGSVHHPKLADFLNADFPIEERLLQKKESLPEIESQEREALQIFSGVKSRYEDAKSRLENAEKPVFEASALLEKAVDKINEATNNREKNRRYNNRLNDLRKKLENARNENNVSQTELVNITQNLSAKSAKLENLTNQFNNLTKETLLQNETAEAAVKRLKSELEKLRNAIESFETEKAQNERIVTECSSEKQVYEKQTENLKKEFDETSLILKEQLQKYNFETVKDLENAFLTEAECASIEEKITEWKAQKEQLSGQIEALGAELKDVTRPDIAKLEEEAKEIAEKYRQKTEELKDVLLKKQGIIENQKKWNDLNDKMLSIEKQSSKYVELSKDLSGDNPKKLSFESWILGVYLEEIAAHASRRLSRISDGRYALHLKTEQTSGRQKYAGLNLEIFDANTGKKRPCDTLSGGETFFVSISLALALTDVVQSRSGGVQLDSLFIDEGFGSLDDATLEKALSVLDEIRENRMIGIISHVGELKNRILHRIEVSKSQNGSTLNVIGE